MATLYSDLGGSSDYLVERLYKKAAYISFSQLKRHYFTSTLVDVGTLLISTKTTKKECTTQQKNFFIFLHNISNTLFQVPKTLYPSYQIVVYILNQWFLKCGLESPRSFQKAMRSKLFS